MARIPLRGVHQGCMRCVSLTAEASNAVRRPFPSRGWNVCRRNGSFPGFLTPRSLTSVRALDTFHNHGFYDVHSLIQEKQDILQRADEYFAQLSEDQRLAVQQHDKVVRVIAGPGSGKTRVLISRVAFLLANGVRPESLLVLTFTNKAAGEMKKRLGDLLQLETRNMKYWCGTFHGTANRILRDHVHRLKDGRTRSFQVIDEDESMKVVLDIYMKKFGVEILETDSAEKKKVKKKQNSALRAEMKSKSQKMFRSIAHVKEAVKTTHNMTGAEAGKLFSLETDLSKSRRAVYEGNDFAWIFDQYHQKLKELNLMDFGELMSCVIWLLKSDDEVLAKYRNQFQHILVDEMQDTNGAQYEFLRLIMRGAVENQSGESVSLFAVGDPNQSIYAFRGARSENLQKTMDDDFSDDISTVFLLENYRSHYHIVRLAERVLKAFLPYTVYSDMTVKRAKELSSRIPVTEWNTDVGEATHVAQLIQSLRMERDIELNEIAILYRVHAISWRFETELLKQGIPCYVIGASFWEKTEVRDCVAYLRFVANPSDKLAFERIYNKPSRGIGEVSFTNLTCWCAQQKLEFPLFLVEDVMDMDTTANTVDDVSIPKLDIPKEAKIPKQAQAGIQKLRQCFVLLRSVARRSSPYEVLETLMERCGFHDYLVPDRGAKTVGKTALQKVDAIGAFKEAIEEIDSTLDATGLESLELLLQEASLLDDISGRRDKNGVQLMTIHASKGLEFKAVLLVACEDEIFPGRVDRPEEQEEEVRLMFVAITRAKEFLSISSARERFINGGKVTYRPSRFIRRVKE